MNEETTKGRTQITLHGDREIHAERVFDAPRERVFEAHTNAALIERWWGPRRYVTKVDALDLRPGGGWRFLNVSADGELHAFRGVFREIEEPERIVWTFEWEGLPGHVSVESLTFEDLGGRTRLRSESLFHTREERDGMAASGMEDGANQSHDRLDELLADDG